MYPYSSGNRTDDAGIVSSCSVADIVTTAAVRGWCLAPYASCPGGTCCSAGTFSLSAFVPVSRSDPHPRPGAHSTVGLQNAPALP